MRCNATPATSVRFIGLAGWSGAGKTTLIRKVIPALTATGLRVSTIKHAHHDFDVDQPGKDSWEHRQAGASETLISSSRRWALMHELRGAPEPTLEMLLAHLAPADLVLVEGFKRGPHPKIEVHRVANGKPMLWPDDGSIVGIATDSVEPCPLPRVALDDVAGVVALVLAGAATAD